MKSCVVAIARLENEYIREWVEYYLNLGFNQVFLGDNNHKNEENLCDPIQDLCYKDGDVDKQVMVFDCRENGLTQPIFYQEVYEQFCKDYFDWCLFCDIDEFLVLEKFDKVNDFLSQNIFNDFDVIKMNWMTMTDNGYLINTGKPIMERLTKEAIPLIDMTSEGEFYENQNCKCFVRSNLDCQIGVHCPRSNDENDLRYCDAIGNKINNTKEYPCWSIYLPNIKHEGAWLKHFRTKTIEEFVKTKMVRGWACYQDDYEHILNDVLNLDMFFNTNEKTPAKLQLAKELIEKYNIPYRNEIK